MKSLSPKLFLFLCAGLSLAACSANETPRRNTAESNPPPVTTRSPAPQESLPAEARPKIVAFGDSLTAGLGLSPAQSYPALLQQKLDAEGYNYEVVNAGISGDTTAGGLRRIDFSLDAGNVRVVVLELGANDFLRGQPVSEARKNLSAMIERIKARGATVLLAGMLTTTNSGERYLREIQQMFADLAREHDVALIPFFLEGVAGNAALNLDDGVHPNAEGHKVVAETVYKYLKPLLEK